MVPERADKDLELTPAVAAGAQYFGHRDHEYPSPMGCGIPQDHTHTQIRSGLAGGPLAALVGGIEGGLAEESWLPIRSSSLPIPVEQLP